MLGDQNSNVITNHEINNGDQEKQIWYLLESLGSILLLVLIWVRHV